MLGAVCRCVMSLNKFWGVTTRSSLSLSMQPSDDPNHFNTPSCLKRTFSCWKVFNRPFSLRHQFFLLLYWLQYQQDLQIPKCLPLVLNHFYSLYFEHEVRWRGKLEVAFSTYWNHSDLLPNTLEKHLSILLFLFEGVATWLLYDALLKGLFVRHNPMSLCATYWMFFFFFSFSFGCSVCETTDFFCWICQTEVVDLWSGLYMIVDRCLY